MLSEQLSLHQRVPDAVGLAAELQEPPVVYDAVLCGAVHYAKPEEGHAGQGPYVPAPALHKNPTLQCVGRHDPPTYIIDST